MKCLLITRLEASLRPLSAETCPLTPRTVLLLPHISSLVSLFLLSFLNTSYFSKPFHSHPARLLTSAFSFLVLRSRYLTPCLHFSSVLLLLLIRLLLSCSLSPLGSHRWICRLTYFARLRVGEPRVCVRTRFLP